MNKIDELTKVESQIYKKLDVLKLTAKERMDLENLVDTLAGLVYKTHPTGVGK